MRILKDTLFKFISIILILINYLIIIFRNEGYLSLIEKSAPFREVYQFTLIGFVIFYLFPFILVLTNFSFKNKLSRVFIQICFIFPNILLILNTFNYFYKITQTYFIIYCFFMFSLNYLERDNESR